MATQVKIGRIIRRGAVNIPHEVMAVLVKNKDKVQEIVSEIDGRSDVLREMQKSTEAESAELDKVSAGLAERETALAEGLAKQEADRAAAGEKHASNMEALTRRTAEVVEREVAANERDAVLDDREATLERGRAEFVALTERLKGLHLEMGG